MTNHVLLAHLLLQLAPDQALDLHGAALADFLQTRMPVAL